MVRTNLIFLCITDLFFLVCQYKYSVFQIVSENLQTRNGWEWRACIAHIQLQWFSMSDSSEKTLIEYLFLCCRIQKILTAIKLYRSKTKWRIKAIIRMIWTIENMFASIWMFPQSGCFWRTYFDLNYLSNSCFSLHFILYR